MSAVEYWLAAVVIVVLGAAAVAGWRRVDRLNAECDELAEERDLATASVARLRDRLFAAGERMRATEELLRISTPAEYDHRAGIVRALEAQRRGGVAAIRDGAPAFGDINLGRRLSEDAAAIRTRLDGEDRS